MTESEIQCLKDNIDKAVEIDTTDGERLVARAISVFQDAGYDEHELFYELISTDIAESYAHTRDAAGYGLDFNKILSVKPYSGLGSSARS